MLSLRLQNEYEGDSSADGQGQCAFKRDVNFIDTACSWRQRRKDRTLGVSNSYGARRS